MSCGIGIGFALADLVIFLLATRATAVAVGKAAQAVEREHLQALMQEAVGQGLDAAALGEGAQQELLRTLEGSGAGLRFDDAEVVIRTGAGDLIGLRRDSEGIYQVIAKWRPGDADRLRVDVSGVEENWRQRYAYLKVKKEAEALGYQVVEEEILPDQSVLIRVRRWD
ncbi:MAG: DUF1257 domain-containing protein [Armatimonadota bacterium]